MIKEKDYLKAKQIVQEYEKQLNISDVIKRKNTGEKLSTKEDWSCTAGYMIMRKNIKKHGKMLLIDKLKRDNDLYFITECRYG